MAFSIGQRLGELHPRRFFLHTWQAMDAEAAALRKEHRQSGQGYDFRPLIVFCAGAAFLTIMEYFGGSRTMFRFVELFYPVGTPAAASPFWSHIAQSDMTRLYGYVWWSGFRVLGYFLLPLMTLWLMGEKLRDYGLGALDLKKYGWVYLLCYLVVLVCVIAVSFTDSFASYYPFYKLSRRSWFDFASWELLYAAQFFSLEFFFRGYWLAACKRMMGSHAIFAMVVPYCMIHFGKPWIEALGAIVAGVVLGTLAMKTRSIWSGFLIHVSVAISMDTAALIQTGGLPDTLLPPGFTG